MSTGKVIKRYANRKLYDTERSCYVTLEDIAAMIRAGEEVQVVDNKSGDDLTSVTLAQIIFEMEKRRSVMPLSLLRDLVVSGGDAVGGFARDHMGKVQARATELKDSAQRIREDLEGRIDRVVHGRESDNGASENRGILSDLVGSSQRALDDLQHTIEDRLKDGVDAVQRRAQVGKVFDEIKQKLTDIESRMGK